MRTFKVHLHTITSRAQASYTELQAKQYAACEALATAESEAAPAAELLTLTEAEEAIVEEMQDTFGRMVSGARYGRLLMVGGFAFALPAPALGISLDM